MFDFSKKKRQTLCWDCANATKPWKCPWAAENHEPVPGWEAEKTIVNMRIRGKLYPTESYCVTACPLFERDSNDGGLYKAATGEKQERKTKDTPLSRNLYPLYGEILAQAVKDWIQLDYGHFKRVEFADGTVKKDEMISFFYGSWFADLVTTCTNYTPQQVRDMLKVPRRGLQR